MPFLLRGPSHEMGLDLEFIREATKRFEDDENLATLFVRAMLEISDKLSTMTMEDDYKPYMMVSIWQLDFPTMGSVLIKRRL